MSDDEWSDASVRIISAMSDIAEEVMLLTTYLEEGIPPEATPELLHTLYAILHTADEILVAHLNRTQDDLLWYDRLQQQRLMQHSSENAMPRSKYPHFTRFEVEVLEIFWRLKVSSIREVLEALPEDRQPAYTTVQTIVRRLEEKGAVRRVKQIGTALLYEPVATPKAAYTRFLDDVVAVFGTAKAAVTHLVDNGALTLSDLKELEKRLKK